MALNLGSYLAVVSAFVPFYVNFTLFVNRRSFIFYIKLIYILINVQ